MEIFLASVGSAITTKAKILTAKAVVGTAKFIIVGGLELIKWTFQ